jgi:hypothetical protein
VADRRTMTRGGREMATRELTGSQRQLADDRAHREGCVSVFAADLPPMGSFEKCLPRRHQISR